MQLKRWDDLVFDIGMNYCEDTDFYLKKGFRVVAVEANPLACGDAEQRYAEAIASGQMTIVNRAISRTREPLKFYLCTTQNARSTASSRLRAFWEARGETFEEIEVQGLTTEDLVARYGVPYYAKIDIEGFDLLCIQAFEQGTEKPRYLSTEVDFYTAGELLNRLERIGYCDFALVGQGTVPSQVPPLTAGEGDYVQYQFKHGCSGLFGRELPAEWLNGRALRRRVRQVIRQYRLSGMLEKCPRIGGTKKLIDSARKHLPLAADWYDLHASLRA